MAIVCLAVVVICLTVLTRVKGSTPAQTQPAASGASNFTEFNAPDAASGALQGTIGASINTEGDVTGVYITAPNVAHGFVRIAATTTVTEFDARDAGAGLNQGTFALSINTEGDVAGIYSDSNTAYHGFVRAGATGTITEFDVTGAPTNTKHRGTVPLNINAAGDITGFYVDVNAVRHGFVRTVVSGTAAYTIFNVTGAGTGATQGTIPMNIDAAGNITGFYVDANGVFHGFLRTADGTVTAPIDASGAGTVAAGKGFKFAGTLPVGLDAAGNITGILADTNGVFHGFVRAANGSITNFDAAVPGTAGFFPGTIPISVNGAGDITGTYEDTNGVNHGFVRAAADGTITAPLDAPGASTSGMFSGTVPFGINSADDLTGTYADANENFHGFVYIPASAAIPTFSPAPGTYSTAQTVTISDATAGATIFYTTDGTVPTTGSTAYSGPITVNSTETIEAIATASTLSNSAVATAAYTIEPAAATPTFSPVSGTYTSVQTVTISDATSGAAIFYTTNGSTPTTASTQYTGPITVNSTETIEAIATASGFSNSAVGTAAYTINLPPPDFVVTVSPTSLTIVAGQSGHATFTVTPENGFNSPVNFACSGLPAGAACSFSPASVTPNGAAVTSTLTVTTTAAGAATHATKAFSHRLSYAFLFPFLPMIFGLTTRRKRTLRASRWLGLLLVLFVVSGLTSCGGGYTSSGGSTGNSGTPVGTSTVSVSAAAGGSGGANHAAMLTITITQ